MDENDIEELLEVVFEELTNELLELEQELIAKEEERKKGTSEKKRTPQTIHGEGFSRSFGRPQQTL